jgi:ectoine hydroxylase-related dioxygenase (phytanoyl-CoA dioxygenase family)
LSNPIIEYSDDFYIEGAAPSTVKSCQCDIELEAGQLSLHDAYLVHGSNPNRSTRRRAGIAIRYMPGSSHFNREIDGPSAEVSYTIDFSQRPLWLLRGEDQTGLNDLQVGHKPPGTSRD